MRLFSRGNIFTFKGGIHPDDMKERTRHLMIEDLSPPEQMIYPMQQHIGKPAKPIVAVGDTVKMGQLLAEADGFVSSPVHASVSGTVTAIKPCLHPNGSMVQSVIITNDFQDTPIHAPLYRRLDMLSAKDIVDITRDAGIVGMGGATFPTHVKLSPPPEKHADTVIINGSECEPYLTSDHRIMLEDPETILDGARALIKALSVKQAVIAIESNKPDAVEAFSAVLTNTSSNDIRIAVLKTKYPQGSEKHLISAITGREVPPGGLPIDVGVVVVNVDTCGAIARAIATGYPLMSRIVTVGGGCVSNHRNFRVRIGTPIKSLVESVGGFKEEPAKIILGGPMMGVSLFSLEVPVIKGTGALIALSKAETYVSSPSPCLRCGECVSICPMRLEPLMLNAYAEKGNIERCMELNILDCIECGACTYICPGKRNPVQNIRVAKQRIAEARAKQVKK